MKSKYAWIMDSLAKTSFSTKARAMRHFLIGKKEYLRRKKTRADMDSVIKCALCPNMCKFDCPVLAAEKNDAMSPSGKTRIAYFIETDRLNSQDAIELMYKCAGCDACMQWCPFDFSVGDILKGVREDIAGMSLAPPRIIKIKENLEKNHTIHERKYDKSTDGKGDVLYFMGCEVSSERGEIADSMTKIFEGAGEKYVLLKDEWCCASPFINLGFTDEFKKFAEHNVKAIEESGCRTMVCSCPTCTYVFRHIYPQFGFEIKARVMHTSEYLLRLMENKKMAKAIEKECVYHDPCALIRKLGLEEEPRKIAKRAGMKIKETYFNRKDTKCCGMGCSLGSTNPDIASKMADARLEELKKQSDCIVTACPTCNTTFRKGGVEVYDISEIVLKAWEKA
ncbi:MAG: (Fe-S)-binding protein [Candidatus Thermoplasmatota archaeon]|nr:(Fe-S)-binding protein [Candidatus Thermoplasmatota archaeon]